MTDEPTAAVAGKARQKRRTRTAILAATQQLLADGATPSMAEIAEAADVSRRTLYQHFPTLDQLLLDAMLGELSEREVDTAIAEADPGGTDAGKRVEAMVRTLSTMSEETLRLGRSMVRLTLAQPPAPGQRRGHRRVGWIEQALEPLRDDLEPVAFERLVSALAMVVGWEALIVLDDVRGLDADDRTQTSLWAARALIDAALQETS
ncbi:TetR/AcrR family transcriptional regulator [Aeromicrobium terrae]|uniref:TetR/AcrR family transcriptional regulator n=1 Tax=Aeromicrobium terrae TaxID=2498846 RepID=A0A5C8NGL9_9ACTN|nr:TetR/AcrR family transcriptional regulator [Aeromicrobium terrae]TXL57484.1 TetR/AcrR family transcriptional regulator [Aeromicrobium terrae]